MPCSRGTWHRLRECGRQAVRAAQPAISRPPGRHRDTGLDGPGGRGLGPGRPGCRAGGDRARARFGRHDQCLRGSAGRGGGGRGGGHGPGGG
ncbi:hypothetical protein FDP22_06105 [Paroceanicella profunda]|uniref:Uncharacterized protein n=1 Tax=Paroceanicella profunda TaxID=2579971 RepID=A0A5B8FYW0_9RHOB|nr:hypothetical protein FDP22_06105 [Paroceanicella profunda]